MLDEMRHKFKLTNWQNELNVQYVCARSPCRRRLDANCPLRDATDAATRSCPACQLDELVSCELVTWTCQRSQSGPIQRTYTSTDLTGMLKLKHTLSCKIYSSSTQPWSDITYCTGLYVLERVQYILPVIVHCCPSTMILGSLLHYSLPCHQSTVLMLWQMTLDITWPYYWAFSVAIQWPVICCHMTSPIRRVVMVVSA